MAKLGFVNRSSEIKSLLADVQGASGRNRIALLISEPGIGKSRLAERLLSLVTERPGVKLRVRAPRKGLSQDGHYIRMLATELDDAAKLDLRIPAFRSFLKKGVPGGDAKRLKKAATAIADSTPILRAARAVAEGARMPVPDARNQFRDPTGENSLLAYEYVLHAACASAPIINIENIQDIDDTSFDLLKRVLEETENVYFLLEYTVSDAGAPWSLGDIAEAFSTRAAIAQYPLEKLRVDDVLRIVKDQPAALEGLVRSLYMKSNGSLRPLTDFFIKTIEDPAGLEIMAGQGAFTELGDFTRASLSELDSSSRLVLVALTLHGGWVERTLLAMVGAQTQLAYTLLDVDTALDDLQSKAFTEAEGDRVRASDGVADFIFSTEFTRERALAVEAWKEIYRHAAEGSGDLFIPKAQAFYFLVYFSYIQDDAIECAKYLDKALYLAARSYVPTRFIAFAKDVRSKLASHRTSSLLSDIDRRLIAALQALSYSDDALHTLDVLPDSVIKEWYSCILLENAGQAKEALAQCNRALSKKSVAGKPRWRLRFELAKFASLRSLCREKECLELYRAMRANRNYQELPEFGYVLRSAGSCCTSEQAIPDLRQSAQFFNATGQPVQEAHSRIELVVALAYSKELDQADAELDAAERLLGGQISERHAILSNRASISMIRGATSQSTLDNLRQAFLTARNGFDKTAIRNNMLIALAALELPAAADAAREAIQSCERGGFTSRELVCITYHNAALYYRQAGDLEAFEQTKAKLVAIRDELKPTWLPDLSALDYTHKMPLIEGKPYYPVFLAHWTLELSGAD